MNGKQAKRLRRRAARDDRQDRRTADGSTRLVPGCNRAVYQTLKRDFRAA